ncbi:class I SAM-dependent methyltransferase [Thiohalocapsa marina]|uniref:Class I SAM-dependent methyltransferase n=1 Tax=Thiohalocapsa marina TaxID=424902 RepID=A0A5M8FVE2_9GAMM|nr:class I SAM-dependent methyltransferase [Thiohalocapsa marina]KAA6187777.1 class I SAM-dependent methyltransferase [Thiohalocapsa marina]
MPEHQPDLRSAYDALSVTYEANRGQFDMTQVLDDLFARLPSRGGALLDLGCGAGEPVAEAFIRRGWDVTGVDVCGTMLDLAARYVPAMRRVCADMREVAFRQGCFDAVTAIYSLFHLPSSEHPDLFARVRDWLRPGGIFLFTYATADYTGAETFDGWKTFMGQRLFYSHRTPADLQAQLQAAGLVPEALAARDIGGERFLWVTASRP